MRYYHLGFALLLFSCSKKDQPAPNPIPTGPVTQTEINKWILDSMRYYYLWSEELPTQSNTDLETRAYFQSIKNAADPFSLVYNPGNFSTMPRYMLYNYGFNYSVVEWPSAPGGTIGVVTLVIPGSNAAKAGFVRGSYFTRINGMPLTAANAASLADQVLKDGQGIFTPATINNSAVIEATPVTVLLGVTSENPIYAQQIINSNNKKIAYLFYNAFKDDFNSALISAFQTFKAQGTTELILDMRYNTGGSVAAAAVLTALIAPGVTSNQLFIQYKGNKTQGTQQLSFNTAMAYPESGAPIPFNSVQPAMLGLSRVFILTSHETISAAELTINNLKPYTKVVQIGATTYGKDKGAINIQDGRGRISWILHPISWRLYNAKGEGGYEQGIAPQYTADEIDTLPIAAIGDTQDPLIAKALSLINGNSRTIMAANHMPLKKYYVTEGKSDAVILPH
ncbi:S41 family peptidase [Chitinophaga sp. 30R24]|uniref:S41 family peptidase n=1 Tax=Chitinophaga sp. 30R24 TaxID=3248838 RepID=UPI003B917F4E